jgi:hypothetical protein
MQGDDPIKEEPRRTESDFAYNYADMHNKKATDSDTEREREREVEREREREREARREREREKEKEREKARARMISQSAAAVDTSYGVPVPSSGHRDGTSFSFHRTGMHPCLFVVCLCSPRVCVSVRVCRYCVWCPSARIWPREGGSFTIVHACTLLLCMYVCIFLSCL